MYLIHYYNPDFTLPLLRNWCGATTQTAPVNNTSIHENVTPPRHGKLEEEPHIVAHHQSFHEWEGRQVRKKGQVRASIGFPVWQFRDAVGPLLRFRREATWWGWR